MTRTNISYILNWDLPGYDYASAFNITNPFSCQRSCDQDSKCRAWSFVNTGQVNDNCFLKTGIPRLEADPTCVSGVKQSSSTEQQQQQLVWVYINRTLSQNNPGASRDPIAAAIWMEATEHPYGQWILGLDIFIDHSVIEVFEPKSGRLAITSRIYPEDDTADKLAVFVNMASTTNQNITINSLDTWLLDSIWT